MLGVARGECCGCFFQVMVFVAWSTGGSTGGSTGVALRARVVDDVLAAENRVARLHVLQRTLPRRCVKDGGVDKLCCEIIFDATSI